MWKSVKIGYLLVTTTKFPKKDPTVKLEEWGVSLITIKVVRPSFRPGLRPREVIVYLDKAKIGIGLNQPIEVILGLNPDGTSFSTGKFSKIY